MKPGPQWKHTIYLDGPIENVAVEEADAVELLPDGRHRLSFFGKIPEKLTITAQTVLLCLVPAVAHGIAFTPVLDSSQVSVSGGGSYRTELGAVISQAYTLSDPGAINGTAVLPIANGSQPSTLAARSEAILSYRLGDNFEAHGTASSRVYAATEELFFLNYQGSAHSSATLDVLFQILAPTGFHFSGILEQDPDRQDFSMFSLSTFGSAEPPLHSYTTSFDLTGILYPGLYQLTALAQANSTGARLNSDSGFAAFHLTANFNQVPDPPIGQAVPEHGQSALLLGLGLVSLLLFPKRHEHSAK